LLATRVIPCLDVDAGRVVKGVNFVGLRDAGDPVELAARYDREGADELVFLDITASSEARDTIIDVVARTAEEVFIPFTVGGGIRTVDDARRILRAGADKVALNTGAVSREEVIEEAYLGVRRKEVREALATLPADQRRVLEMAYFGGKTQVVIAEELGIPIGTVKTRTLAAIRKLRVALAREDEG